MNPKDYSQMIAYLTRPAMARGGRIGFDNGGQTFVEQAKELGISKSAFRKPYAPEIENRIIELHQNDKMGAQAIADKLTEEFDGNFSRAPVGKRIKALKAEGKIKDVPYKERKASIDQRREFYGKPRGEQYLAVREVKDIDRTTRFKDTGKLKYNIPKDAKFKVDFKNPGVSGATVSDIPEKFRGIQYYKTKKQAEKAVAERKKLKLKADVDPDEAKRSANKKKYDLVKEVSDNNIEDKLAEFKKGEPLEKAHRLSLEQVKKTGQLYNVMDLGLDFDDPKFVQINNEAVKPFENKLKQLYKEQNSLYKKSSNLKTIPNELRKQIEFNNKKISTVVDLAGGRVQGLQLDEITLKPKVYGRNYANVLGFGLYDKPVKQLTKEDRAAIGAIMQGQVDNEKRTAGKTAQKLFKNKELLKDVDKLAVQGFRPGERGSIDRQLLIDAGKGLGKAGTFAFDKVVRPLGTRAASIPLAGLTVAENIRKGENVADAVIDPLVGLELSFPGLFKENVAKITTNPTAQRILNLGRFARLTTPVGLGITAAGLGIDATKFTRDRIRELQAMTPEQRQQLRAEQSALAFEGARDGGLIGKKSGPPPISGPTPHGDEGLPGIFKRVKKG